jgi:hypothetical protein
VGGGGRWPAARVTIGEWIEAVWLPGYQQHRASTVRDVKTVQSRLRHGSASTTLDTYGHMFPDRDESTRAAVEAVFQDRTEQGRNSGATS